MVLKNGQDFKIGCWYQEGFIDREYGMLNLSLKK